MSPTGSTENLSGLLPYWKTIDTGFDTQFRSLAVVTSRVVWLGGYDGVVLRTLDGGQTWVNVSPVRGEEFQFRGIAALSETTAIVLSSGPGESARLYRTENGGASWDLVFQALEANCYLNAVAFADENTGVAVGDPIDGVFFVLRTIDGGRNWSQVEETAPAALPGEGAYAASGSCLVACSGHLWLGTGGAERSRVLRSRDGGLTWQAFENELKTGEMSGIFGLAFADTESGIAVGGVYDSQDPAVPAVAVTESGSQEWRELLGDAPRGYRSGAAFIPGRPGSFVTVGLEGSEITSDGGVTWHSLDAAYDAVECSADGSVWASGEAGRVAVLAGYEESSLQ